MKFCVGFYLRECFVMTIAEKTWYMNQWKVINMHDSYSSKLSYVNYLFSKVSEEVLPLIGRIILHFKHKG